MIRLEVQPYCDNCMAFEPDVERPIALYADGKIIDRMGDTIVRCQHRERCKSLVDYIKSKS